MVRDLLHTQRRLSNLLVTCFTSPEQKVLFRIETLCSNDLSEACSDVSVLGSSPSATNSTINYWTKVWIFWPIYKTSSGGKELSVPCLSFLNRANSRGNEGQEGSYQEDHSLKGKVFEQKYRHSFQIGAKSDVVLNGLSENEIYTVRRCIVIDLPRSLMTDQRFKFYSKKNKICVEEGYRTERSSSSFRVVPTILCLLFIFFL